MAQGIVIVKFIEEWNNDSTWQTNACQFITQDHLVEYHIKKHRDRRDSTSDMHLRCSTIVAGCDSPKQKEGSQILRYQSLCNVACASAITVRSRSSLEAQGWQSWCLQDNPTIPEGSQLGVFTCASSRLDACHKNADTTRPTYEEKRLTHFSFAQLLGQMNLGASLVSREFSAAFLLNAFFFYAFVPSVEKEGNPK